MVLMLGGSDPRGLTEPVAKYLLSRFPTYSLAVVAGPAYRGLESLQRMVAEMDRLSLHVNPENLAEILTSCDLVVTAAGGSVGELCALGQMAVCLVVVDNQIAALRQCPYPVVDARQCLLLDELGDQVAKALGSAQATLETRARAHKLVDGKGCERILDVMQAF
jgi:spore coat polysaccharide biosynthesis predicted glycosyltransferase SpsG